MNEHVSRQLGHLTHTRVRVNKRYENLCLLGIKQEPNFGVKSGGPLQGLAL